MALSIVVTTFLCVRILEYVMDSFLISDFLLTSILVAAVTNNVIILLAGVARERLVEVECQLLEQRIPLIVRPGSKVVEK